MIHDTDKAYIAGLFDGEGSINFTRRPEKKKKHKVDVKMGPNILCSIDGVVHLEMHITFVF